MRLFVVLLSFAALAFPAERLKLRFFHDENATQLVLNGLAFADANRGIAVGGLVDEKGKSKPAAVVTTDAGAHWIRVGLPEEGAWVSIFGETTWLGTARHVFRSPDLGHSWKRVGGLDRIASVWFTDAEHGWAVGANKTVRETADGGKTWTPVPAADQPKTTKENTTYRAIAFADPQHGMIVGNSQPRRPADGDRLPDWVDPMNRRREWPGVLVELETKDGGRTWTSSETAAFGVVTRLRVKGATALALFEFWNEFPYPAEVVRINLANGTSGTVYRRKDRAVTDLTFSASDVWVAAIEPPGKILRAPIPGKLYLAHADNQFAWNEIPVDYRAEGTRAALAWAGDKLWVALDTGMLLSVENE